jgi:hypothetical protein
MKSRPVFLFALVFCLLLAACNMPGQTTDTGSAQSLVETSVAATVQALTQAAPPQQSLATPTLEGQAAPTLTSSPTLDVTLTPEPGYGSISGGIIGYPYGDLPQITIVAFEQEAPYHYWYLLTIAGDTYFSMDGYISSGKYQVVAYDPSGNTGGCVTIVEVKNNETVTCDITNWGSGYPAKPAGVP